MIFFQAKYSTNFKEPFFSGEKISKAICVYRPAVAERRALPENSEARLLRRLLSFLRLKCTLSN